MKHLRSNHYHVVLHVNKPKANAGDNCTGRFWGRFLLLQNRHTIHPVYKGRFSSQALLDESAFAACMAINIKQVDLNPIRSDIAKAPETSDHTRVKNAFNTF